MTVCHTVHTMTTTNDTPVVRRRVRVRTLGLPATSERALMGKAYEVYASAQAAQKAWHNEWRRLRRLYTPNDQPLTFADDIAVVQNALKKATEAAFYLADAKAQYRIARRAAELAGRAA